MDKYGLNDLLIKKKRMGLNDLIKFLDLCEEEVLFWSGSWADGFANKESDLDLYVIGNVKEIGFKTYEYTAHGFHELVRTQIEGKGVRMDVTYIVPDIIIQVADYFNKYDPENDYATTWSPNFIELIHRIKIAIPVINDEKLKDYQKLIDFNKFSAYLANYYHRLADSLQQDVLGLIDEKEYVSAYLVAIQRLKCIVDIYLVKKGETNTRVEKWRMKKLKRIDDNAGVKENYLKFLGRFKSDVGENDVRCINEYIEELIFETI